MADRQILIAAYETSPDSLGAIFPGQEEPRTDGAWTWLRLDPWAPGRERMEAGLCDLNGPVIRVATEDDCRWYLRLCAGGEPLLCACNHLALLGGEEYEDAEFESLGELLDDYNELVPQDCCPPASVRQHDAAPPDEGVALYLKVQAVAVAEALATLSIPHDPDEVVSCLTGQSMSDGERDWPLGNLPRFADCLGLPAFAGWQEELAEYEDFNADCDDEDDEDDGDEDDEDVEEDASDAEVIFAVLEVGEELGDFPLEDDDGEAAGALEVPAAQLQQVRLLSWFCDQSADTALRLRLPADGVGWSELPHQASELPEGFLVDAMEGGRVVRLGLRPTSIWEERPLLGLLGRVLEVLPDGARVELMSCSDLEDRTAGSQRYCGPVREGVWHLELTYPPRKRQELQEALELSAQVDAAGPVLAASEEEAAAVAAAAQETMDVRQRGVELWGDDDSRLHLVRLLFRQRFQQRWELEEELAEEQLAPLEMLSAAAPGEQDMSMAFIEASQTIGDMFNRIMGKAPPDAEELHQGEAARFFRIDLEEHIGGNPLVKFAGLLGNDPGDGEEADWTVQSVDAGMEALGFAQLGDLVCDRFMEVPMRGYALPAGDTYGTLVTSPMGEAFPEFYSQFDDGASLITSVKADQPSPENKMFRLHLTGGTIEQLYAKHRQGIELRAREDAATALPAEPALEGLARAIDAYIKRRL